MAFDTNTVAAPTTFTENPDSVNVQPVAAEPIVLTDTFGGVAANQATVAPETPQLSQQFEVAVSAPPPAPEPVSHPSVGVISFQAEAPQIEQPQLEQDFTVAAPQVQPDTTVTSEMTHEDGGLTIVTNPNLAYDVQLTGEDLEANGPVIAPVAEIFDFLGTKEVANELPEREVTVVQPVPELPKPDTTWTQRQDFDTSGPSGMA